jgi:hypothetical protein
MLVFVNVDERFTSAWNTVVLSHPGVFRSTIFVLKEAMVQECGI